MIFIPESFALPETSLNNLKGGSLKILTKVGTIIG